MIGRRNFMGLMGVLSAGSSAGSARPRRSYGSSVYRKLGVRPFINAAGPYTSLSACTMPGEVVRAMEDAAKSHVSLSELQAAISERVAVLLGCEAALVTAGCAAALTHATAACVTGTDPEKIRRLPDTSGMKNEVIFQRTHRFSFDHAIRTVGVQIVEVDTRSELEAAISDRTAMLFFLNWADSLGEIHVAEFARIARDSRVPCLIDCAADLPPRENLSRFTSLGYDLVAFSGGKTLRGPQCSGLLLGKKALIEAAFLNGSPHPDSVGRIAKVGKEEMVGLLTALELYLESDHKAEWEQYERQAVHIQRELSRIPGVTAGRFAPETRFPMPKVKIRWSPDQIPLSAADIVGDLRAGDPRIEIPPGSETLVHEVEVAVWALKNGEEKIVARRLREALTKNRQA